MVRNEIKIANINSLVLSPIISQITLIGIFNTKCQDLIMFQFYVISVGVKDYLIIFLLF